MPKVKNMSNIFRIRQFSGACDYFKISEEGREMYVGTKYQCPFLPCEAKMSFLVTSDKSEAIPLPAVVRRSVRWAWIRTVAWACALVTIKAVVIGFIIEVRREEPVTGWVWALVVLLPLFAAGFLGLAIVLQIYKPHASEESRQKYMTYLRGLLAASRRRRRGQASQDRTDQMAAAAAVHGGPADDVVTIEPHPLYPGPRKDSLNVPLITGSPTSIPTPGNPNSTSIETEYPTAQPSSLTP
ncbi:uncharacterized protein LOC144860581 isoform X1 [Branchiostoma floridae x Branchiostoma japonicum]